MKSFTLTGLSKPILFIAFLFSAYFVNAQSYRGKVVDENRKPAAFVTVVLENAETADFIAGDITKDDGSFAVQVQKAASKMRAKITSVGYQTKLVDIIADTLGTIQLVPSATQMAGVTVTAQRKAFKIENGGISADVANSVLSRETNMTELIRKVPGMRSDNGKLVSIKGGEPIVYINGRKAMSMNEVNALEVKNIKSIKLITNPGSEYDASTGAVLLITTKQALEGLSLQVDAESMYNHALNHSEAIKLNYQTGKLNLFGTFGYDYTKERRIQDFYIKSSGKDIWEHDLSVTQNYKDKSANYSLGFNYDVNKNHSFGLRYDGGNGNNVMPMLVSDTSILNGAGYSGIASTLDLKAKDQNNHINGFYSGKLTPKASLNLYADYVKQHQENKQVANESSIKFGNNTVTTSNLSNFDMVALKGILKYALTENQSLSAGSEMSNVNGDGNVDYKESNDNDSRFNTLENKTAFFANYNLQWKTLSLNAGLRYEYIWSKNENLIDQTKTISKDYTHLFPSLALTYTHKALTQSLSYRVSTRRPPFSWLSSNTVYINRFQQQIGNPLLTPQYKHTIQYMLMYKILYLSASYNYNKDFLANYLYQDTKNEENMVFSWKNYDHQQSVEIQANVKYKFGFYEPDLTVAFQKQFFNITYNDKPLDLNKPFLYADFNNYFHLPKDYLFNAEYVYTSGGSVEVFTLEPTHVFNAGVQKSFFKDKLAFTLKMNDIFNGSKQAITSSISKIYLTQKMTYDNRKVSLHVTWRFNNYKKSYKGQNADDDAMRRMGK